MKIDKLLKDSFVRNKTNTFSVDTAKGKMNGLLIGINNDGLDSQPWDMDTITVYLRGDKSEVLVNRMPLFLLKALSDYQLGYTGSGMDKALQVMSGYLDTTAWLDDTGEAFINWREDWYNSEQNVFCLDLGMLHLGETELVIELEFGSVSEGTVENRICVYTYLNDESTDYQLKYNITKDRDGRLKDTSSIYAFPTAKKDLMGRVIKDVEYTIDTETVGTIRQDVFGAIMSTQIFGAYESVYGGLITELYTINDAIPEDLYLRYMGVDADKVSILHVQKILNSRSVSMNTLSQMEELINRISKLERTKPEMAKALRDSGATVRSEDLEEVKRSITPTL